MNSRVLNAVLSIVGCTLIGCASTDKNGSTPTTGEVKSPALPTLTRTITLPGVGIPTATGDPAAIPGRLDHLAYDPATGRLFIAGLEQGSLEVVDLNKGERIKRIEGLKKPQGIAVIASEGRLVVACGGENAVHVYSLDDLKELAVVPVGQDADNVRSDGTSRAYIGFGSGQAGGLAVFDAAALKKAGEIPLPSHPESFQFDLRPGSEHIIVNLPGQKRADNDGSVALVDKSMGQTLATWGLANAARNFPMALDAGRDRVFVACRKPPLLICLDAKTGAEISRAPCVADSDDLYFDDATNRVMVIGGGHRAGETAPTGAAEPGADAALDIFQVDGEGKLSSIASIPTASHARTGFFVAQRRAIYIVCPPAGGQDARVMEFSLGK